MAAQASVSSGDIVYAQNAGDGVNERIVLRHGTTETTLLGTGANQEPDVSTDGTRIVFQDDPNGFQAIAVMNSDGSAVTQLTNPSYSASYNDEYPRWSPDGTKIAFDRYDNTSGTRHIWVMNSDGTGATDLTSGDSSGNPDQSPAWSPDGTKLVYTHFDGSNAATWVMGSGGASPHAVDNGTDEVTPDWSPDGTRIYLASGGSLWSGGVGYLTSSDSFATVAHTTRHQLVGSTAENERVSGNGATLYFDEGNGAIYSVPTSGGSVTQVVAATSPAADLQPAAVKASWPNGTTKNLVGLGDSVAAGEGINYGWAWDGSQWNQTGPTSPFWQDTTASIGANFPDCHQSGRGYPGEFAVNGDNYHVYNMACTGAQATAGVLAQQSVGSTTVGAQLGGSCTGCDAANPVYDAHNPDVVTLTVGADDIHFADWVKTCYAGVTGCNTTGNTTTLNTELSAEQLNLRTVLAELNRRAGLASKTVRVLVTNYYDPFSTSHTSCGDISGGGWPGISTGTGSELSWLKSGLASLNSNIGSEVTYAQAHDPHLSVSLVDISGIVSGHEFCTSDPWVYGPSIDYPSISYPTGNDNPAPFHPTPAGQAAIYAAVKAAI